MNRDEALKLLRGGPEGIAVWNQIRTSGEAVPDLSGANLSGANLSEANLSEANLSGVNLSRAKLRLARLRVSNLTNAKFDEADLFAANLCETNLNGATFRKAKVHGTNFLLAKLDGADLSEAQVRFAVFAQNDLSKTKGLHKVVHPGPSEISISTLVASRGKISKRFLRGCGVPDALIEPVPSSIARMPKDQFYSCFICCSTKNNEFANQLCTRMRAKGLRVWFAPEDLRSGKKLVDQNEEAIKLYDKQLVVLSPESMSSLWVHP
jgi:hypothetical protein